MQNSDNKYYIGVMSGTSLDAIDVTITSFDDSVEIVSSKSFDIPLPIRQSIESLCSPGDNEIHRMSELDNQLAQLFASSINSLIDSLKIDRRRIQAIGSHGQTIRHMPNNKLPYTLQIGNGALISKLTGITTVTDFRRADIAAGGQGAPLVPAFHSSIFSKSTKSRVILNIGGMANITILNNQPSVAISGFDTGPGNILLNEWILLQQNLSYDKDGAWSTSQNYDEYLLELMLQDSYFQLPPPKSTGREYFNLSWVKNCIASLNKPVSVSIVQSTLCELTARSICDAISKYAHKTDEVVLCGGGAHNKDLVSRIKTISGLNVISSAEFGIDPDFVEAAAFAWLSKQTLEEIPANIPGVTGADQPVVLGAIYPRSLRDT